MKDLIQGLIDDACLAVADEHKGRAHYFLDIFDFQPKAVTREWVNFDVEIHEVNNGFEVILRQDEPSAGDYFLFYGNEGVRETLRVTLQDFISSELKHPVEIKWADASRHENDRFVLFFA